MNQDYQDKIDQYLLGQMNEDVRLAFEKEMESDSELQGQFKFTKDVKKVVSDRNRRLTQIREWEKDYNNKKKVATIEKYEATGSGFEYSKRPDSTYKKTSRHAKRQYIYWITGVAAIFIVGFFLFKPVSFDQNEDMSNPVPMSQGSLRGSEDNSAIKKDLEEGRYDAALVLIEDRERSIEEEKALMEQNKSEIDSDEYSYLQEVFQIQSDELHLLKAYALIGLKRINEAIEILEELRQEESPFKLQADSLYNHYK